MSNKQAVRSSRKGNFGDYEGDFRSKEFGRKPDKKERDQKLSKKHLIDRYYLGSDED